MLRYELLNYSIIVSAGRQCNDSNLNCHAAVLDDYLTRRRTLKSPNAINRIDDRIDHEANQIMRWSSSSAGTIPALLLEVEASRRNP